MMYIIKNVLARREIKRNIRVYLLQRNYIAAVAAVIIAIIDIFNRVRDYKLLRNCNYYYY